MGIDASLPGKTHVQLAHGHHDPIVQVLPDHGDLVKSRVAQRCLVDLYQGTRGTRFVAEATLTFREERPHSWLAPHRFPPHLPIFRFGRLSAPTRMSALTDRIEARQVRGKPEGVPIEKDSTGANEGS